MLGMRWVVEITRAAKRQANHEVDIICYVGRIGWRRRRYSADNVGVVERQSKCCGRGKRTPVGAGVVVKGKHCGAKNRSQQRKFLQGNNVIYLHSRFHVVLCLSKRGAKWKELIL
jgi:hypothetical protein